MDFVTGLPILTNWKRNNYNLILIIIDWLIKRVYNKPVKIIINTPGLAEVIIDMVIQYHNLLNSIFFDKSLVFTSKFWLLLCYFFGIKKRLSIAFYPQINGETKR